jgi:hypothetical protein
MRGRRRNRLHPGKMARFRHGETRYIRTDVVTRNIARKALDIIRDALSVYHGALGVNRAFGGIRVSSNLSRDGYSAEINSVER